MSTVEELEAAVQRLSPEDRAAFRAWFAEFDAAEWDRQLEADASLLELLPGAARASKAVDRSRP